MKIKTEQGPKTLKLTVTEEDYLIIECLDKIFRSDSEFVRRFKINGVTYIVLCDICKLLNLSNTTNVIRKLSTVSKRDDGGEINIMLYIESVNKFREVHLVTVEGVFQVLMNGKSNICKNIVNHLSCRVLTAYAARWS